MQLSYRDLIRICNIMFVVVSAFCISYSNTLGDGYRIEKFWFRVVAIVCITSVIPGLIFRLYMDFVTGVCVPLGSLVILTLLFSKIMHAIGLRKEE